MNYRKSQKAYVTIKQTTRITTPHSSLLIIGPWLVSKHEIEIRTMLCVCVDFFVCVGVCVCPPSRSCVCFLCLLVSCTCEYGSLAVSIRKISCWQPRAKASSWPSHHALSVGSLECAGMWAPTGGEVLLRGRHPDTTINPLSFTLFLPQLVSLHAAPSLLCFPSVLCLENECQKTALLFSLCTWGVALLHPIPPEQEFDRYLCRLNWEISLTGAG